MSILQNNINEKDVDLVALISAVFKHLWTIIFVGLIAGAATLVLTKMFVTPVYTATVSMYVNNFTGSNTQNTISSNDISASIMLTNTYLSIVQSDRILDDVIEKTEVKYTTEELKEMLVTDTAGDTEVLTFSFKSHDPKEAALLANTLSDVVADTLPDIVEGSSVKQLDMADIPDKKTSPSYIKRSLVGVIIGMLFTTMIFSFLFILDKRIKKADDLADFNYPVIGVIPDMSKKYGKAYSYEYQSRRKRK